MNRLKFKPIIKRGLLVLMNGLMVVLTCLPLMFNNSLPTSALTIYTNIGRYAYTTPVSVRQKVYINRADKAFIESTGRDVYSEPSSGGIILPDPLSNSNSLDINSILPISFNYYYYADANHPKITCIVDIYNDIQSLLLYLQLLENKASQYGLSGSTKINAILSYIRTFNSSYANNDDNIFDYWGVTAGRIHQGFIDYVDQDEIVNNGLSIKNYFASFINEPYFNSYRHSNVGAEYIENNLGLIDDLTENSIDLIHLFASIDGVYVDTGYNVFGNLLLQHDEQQDLVTWAGDLQQEINNLAYNNNQEVLNSFADILNRSDSSFSYSDFIADVIAMNLCKYFLDYTTDGTISTSFNNYYWYYDSFLEQLDDFREQIIRGYELSNSTYLDVVKYVVYKFCDIKYTYNSSSNTWITSDIFSNNDSQYLHSILYKNNVHPTFELRLQIANLFIDYII